MVTTSRLARKFYIQVVNTNGGWLPRCSLKWKLYNQTTNKDLITQKRETSAFALCPSRSLSRAERSHFFYECMVWVLFYLFICCICCVWGFWLFCLCYTTVVVGYLRMLCLWRQPSPLMFLTSLSLFLSTIPPSCFSLHRMQINSIRVTCRSSPPSPPSMHRLSADGATMARTTPNAGPTPPLPKKWCTPTGGVGPTTALSAPSFRSGKTRGCLGWATPTLHPGLKHPSESSPLADKPAGLDGLKNLDSPMLTLRCLLDWHMWT